MVKAEVIADFHLSRFNELKNLTRANTAKNALGYLYTGDSFECTDDMAKYLTKTNTTGKAYIKVTAVYPELPKNATKTETKIKVEEEIEEKPKRITRRRKSVAKK